MSLQNPKTSLPSSLLSPVSRTSVLCNQTLTRASRYLWNKVQTSSPQIYDVNTNYFLKIYHPTSLEMVYVQVEKKKILNTMSSLKFPNWRFVYVFPELSTISLFPFFFLFNFPLSFKINLSNSFFLNCNR